MSPKTPRKTVTLRLPPDLWEAARAAAEARETTVTAIIEARLRDYVRRYGTEGGGR